MSSRRTYADAVSWMRHARPGAPDRRGLPFRIFGACLAAGVVFWGIGAYVNPERFGQPGGEVLSLGWPSAVYGGLVAGCALALLLAGRRIGWVVRRVREPYQRTLAEHPSYEGAVNALAACARPLQVRFAIGWTWGPMIAVVAAALLAFSSAYLIVYTVLSRFEVGLQTYAIAIVDTVLGLTLLLIVAGRLTTWRVATSVYRSIILM